MHTTFSRNGSHNSFSHRSVLLSSLSVSSFENYFQFILLRWSDFPFPLLYDLLWVCVAFFLDDASQQKKSGWCDISVLGGLNQGKRRYISIVETEPVCHMNQKREKDREWNRTYVEKNNVDNIPYSGWLVNVTEAHHIRMYATLDVTISVMGWHSKPIH